MLGKLERATKLLSNLTAAVEEQSCSYFWLPDINFFEDLSKKDLLKEGIESSKRSQRHLLNFYLKKKEKNSGKKIGKKYLLCDLCPYF